MYTCICICVTYHTVSIPSALYIGSVYVCGLALLYMTELGTMHHSRHNYCIFHYTVMYIRVDTCTQYAVCVCPGGQPWSGVSTTRLQLWEASIQG